MKNQAGIWIDGTKARIITFYDGKETIREIVSDIENHRHHQRHEGDMENFRGSRHHDHEATFGHRKRHLEFQYLDKVIAEVKDANEIFIMGPSGMKKKLQARLEADKQLQAKLSGILATDHLTLNQCVEKVREFYNL